MAAAGGSTATTLAVDGQTAALPPSAPAPSSPSAAAAAPLAPPVAAAGAAALSPPAPAPHRTLPGVVVRLGVLAGAVSLAAFVYANWNAWIGSSATQRTDDAYLAGDLTPMSARVAGLVRTAPITDYQAVRRGDLLVEIVDDDYRAQVRQAEANLASADAQLLNVQAQRSLQEANIAAAAAAEQAEQASLQRDAAEAERQRELLATGIAGTRQRVEQATATSRQTTANLERSRAQVQAAVRQLAVYDAQERSARAAQDASRAMLDLARINLSYTRITAPADGVVGARQVRPGQYVGVGTQVVTVVPLPNVWVIANYKETQLTNVQPGQPATVTVDTFPGVMLRGRVEGFAPASGSQFSLLPADNATGNFTKVVQRIPIRIVLEIPAALAGKLRPGMSVVASVHTRGGGDGAAGARGP